MLKALVLYWFDNTGAFFMKIFDTECETAADAFMLAQEKAEAIREKYGVRSMDHHDFLKSEDYNKALNWFLQEQEKEDKKSN